MIAEREKVFQMNNHIIKSFKLPRGAYARTLFRIVPPEISLTLMFLVFAVVAVWGSTRIMRWAASTHFLGQHMYKVDPEDAWWA